MSGRIPGLTLPQGGYSPAPQALGLNPPSASKPSSSSPPRGRDNTVLHDSKIQDGINNPLPHVDREAAYYHELETIKRKTPLLEQAGKIPVLSWVHPSSPATKGLPQATAIDLCGSNLQTPLRKTQPSASSAAGSKPDRPIAVDDDDDVSMNEVKVTPTPLPRIRPSASSGAGSKPDKPITVDDGNGTASIPIDIDGDGDVTMEDAEDDDSPDAEYERQVKRKETGTNNEVELRKWRYFQPASDRDGRHWPGPDVGDRLDVAKFRREHGQTADNTRFEKDIAAAQRDLYQGGTQDQEAILSTDSTLPTGWHIGTLRKERQASVERWKKEGERSGLEDDGLIRGLPLVEKVDFVRHQNSFGPVSLDSGNCYWTCLALLLNGDAAQWLRVKGAHLAHFARILLNPSHPKHELYSTMNKRMYSTLATGKNGHNPGLFVVNLWQILNLPLVYVPIDMAEVTADLYGLYIMSYTLRQESVTHMRAFGAYNARHVGILHVDGNHFRPIVPNDYIHWEFKFPRLTKEAAGKWVNTQKEGIYHPLRTAFAKPGLNRVLGPAIIETGYEEVSVYKAIAEEAPVPAPVARSAATSPTARQQTGTGSGSGTQKEASENLDLREQLEKVNRMVVEAERKRAKAEAKNVKLDKKYTAALEDTAEANRDFRAQVKKTEEARDEQKDAMMLEIEANNRASELQDEVDGLEAALDEANNRAAQAEDEVNRLKAALNQATPGNPDQLKAKDDKIRELEAAVEEAVEENARLTEENVTLSKQVDGGEAGQPGDPKTKAKPTGKKGPNKRPHAADDGDDGGDDEPEKKKRKTRAPPRPGFPEAPGTISPAACKECQEKKRACDLYLIPNGPPCTQCIKRGNLATKCMEEYGEWEDGHRRYAEGYIKHLASEEAKKKTAAEQKAANTGAANQPTPDDGKKVNIGPASSSDGPAIPPTPVDKAKQAKTKADAAAKATSGQKPQKIVLKQTQPAVPAPQPAPQPPAVPDPATTQQPDPKQSPPRRSTRAPQPKKST